MVVGRSDVEREGKQRGKKGGEREREAKTEKSLTKYRGFSALLLLTFAFLNTFPFFLCVYSGNLVEY